MRAASAAPVRVTDVAEDEDLAPVWADAQSETALHYQRAAALRQLAALARAGLTSDPGGRRCGAQLRECNGCCGCCRARWRDESS